MDTGVFPSASVTKLHSSEIIRDVLKNVTFLSVYAVLTKWPALVVLGTPGCDRGTDTPDGRR